MGKSKENVNKNVDKKLKNPISKLHFVFIGVLVSLFIFMGYYFLDMTKNPYDYTTRTPYQDENVNFAIQVPDNWTIVKTEAEEVKKVTDQSTGGTTFDLMYYALDKEVTPFTLLQPSTKDDQPFKKLMFFSFFGSDEKFSFMENPKDMEDDFKKILESLGNKSIKINRSEIIDNGILMGYIIEATGHMDGNKIYYTQYLEPVGLNIMRIIHSSMDGKGAEEDLEPLLSTLFLIDTGVKDKIKNSIENNDDTDTENESSKDGESTSEGSESPKEESKLDEQSKNDGLNVITDEGSDFEVKEYKPSGTSGDTGTKTHLGSSPNTEEHNHSH